MKLPADARGFFLTLEGPDGSGKSTQAQRLAARLAQEGFETVLTREPGGTPLGEEVRQILLHSDELRPTAATDALLFNAARAQLVAEVIAPALDAGKLVVCDRHADSTLAYQGYGGGRPLAALRAIGAFATGGLVPDMTILFDLPVEVGLTRKGSEANRFEVEHDVAFHQRVREGFLALAAASPERFFVVDATLPADELTETVLAEVESRLAARPIGLAGTGNGNVSEPQRRFSSRSEPKASAARRDK